MMTLFKEFVFASALSLAAIVSLGHAHAHEIKFKELVIGHPWARPSPMAKGVAAGFMTITNKGTADDRLIGASASISGKTQIHDMKMVGDVMKMQELADGIPIPAGATVALKPKSLHLMFLDVKEELMEGEEFTGTLTFEKAGTVTVEFEVAAPDAHMD